MAFVACAFNARAETIIVIDDNGFVRQQMTTSQATLLQPVVATQPSVTVVRESPNVSNSYYYDNYSTGSAIVAGVTTAVVGALLFDGFKHHRKSAPAKIIVPANHHKVHHGSHGSNTKPKHHK